MGNPLLGPDGGDRFRFRIDLHAVLTGIHTRGRLAQFADSPRSRIAVIARVLRGFDELFHDVGRRGNIRIAHAEIDDIVPFSSGLHLQIVYDREDIGRHAFNAVKFFHPSLRESIG
jgi:hypothetical protein